MITPDKKTKRKNIFTAIAIIARAVTMFFFLVFLSGIIIIFYLSEKGQKLKINKVSNIQILFWPFSD